MLHMYMSRLIPAGAEHDSNRWSSLVERLCGGGLLQFYRPARAGEIEAPTTSQLFSYISLFHVVLLSL